MGAVHVSEAVARTSEGDEGPAAEPEVAEALVIVRHRLWGRMARPVPAQAGAPPRGLLPPF